MNYNLIKVIFSLFKKKSGYTFTNFLNKVRVEKSKKYILKKDLSILDVAVLIGFNSQNYFLFASSIILHFFTYFLQL